jgi:hypothetical protein
MKIKTGIWCYNPGDEFQGYSLADFDMSTEGWYHVKAVEIEFEEPTRAEMMPGAVAALKAQKAKILAEAQEQVNKIEDAINRLCALEN